jgi:hypothetical protein
MKKVFDMLEALEKEILSAVYNIDHKYYFHVQKCLQENSKELIGDNYTIGYNASTQYEKAYQKSLTAKTEDKANHKNTMFNISRKETDKEYFCEFFKAARILNELSKIRYSFMNNNYEKGILSLIETRDKAKSLLIKLEKLSKKVTTAKLKKDKTKLTQEKIKEIQSLMLSQLRAGGLLKNIRSEIAEKYNIKLSTLEHCKKLQSQGLKKLL